MVSLGVHPSSSAKHKFWESWNVNGSDSVTQNYPEVCQQGHRSVMGCNSIPPSRILSQDPEEMQKPMRFCVKFWWSSNKRLNEVLGDKRQMVIMGSIKNSSSKNFFHTAPVCHPPKT